MIYENYTHMKCNCGGIIGMRDKENFSCDKCGKVYRIGSGYDVLMTNEKTGWIFPMVKKEKLMKVWITKYALTDGIIEAEIIEQWNVRNDPVCVMVKYLCQSQNSNKYILDSDDFCFDYECAIQKAEEMRQKKIASLKKQIEKLEEMRFE